MSSSNGGTGIAISSQGLSMPTGTQDVGSFAPQQNNVNWVSAAGNVVGDTAAGAEVGGGWGAVAGAAVGIGTDLLTYFLNQANVNTANAEGYALYSQNRKDQLEQNRFNENMATETLNMQKSQNAFNNNPVLNGTMIKQLTSMVNNNDALKNSILARAGGR